MPVVRRPLECLRRLGSRVEVEQNHAELHRGDAVDHRVMDLAEHRRASSAELRHDRDLPQRPRAIELLGEEAAGQPL